MPREARSAAGLWCRRIAMVLAVAILPAGAAAGGYDRTGEASWYGARYQGRTTASGQPFDRNAMTAAHRKLPFGTLVRVTNLANQRTVFVRINDRGPYARGRIIDLSERAAELLGFTRRGTARVRVEAVPEVRSAQRIQQRLQLSTYAQPIRLRPPGGARR